MPSLARNRIAHGIEMRPTGATERVRATRAEHGLEPCVKGDFDQLKDSGETCAHERNGDFESHEDLRVGEVP